MNTSISQLYQLSARAMALLIDPTIVLSFSRPGFLIHSQLFDPQDLASSLASRRFLITGANSGIGYASAVALTRLGAEIVLLCRNPARGEAALKELRRETGSLLPRVETLDVANLQSIRDFAERFREPVHGLIHNAGVLPEYFQQTAQQLELCMATNVIGPHLLTRLLLPNLRAAGEARVIFVSSGGMYPQKLDTQALEDPPEEVYDGVRAYARSKRAQVCLSELWAERNPELRFHAMHPGWADTPAVRTSLPRFWKLTRTILRTPEQGADTVVWLAACQRIAQETGRFWFDRQARPTHLLPWTRETRQERLQLWELCERLTRCEATPAAIASEDGGRGAEQQHGSP